MSNKTGRRERQFEVVDNYPPELRRCVQEFGYPIVSTCLQFGVSNPKHVRELVHEIWAGARQIDQVGGPEGTLDWVLLQAGVHISAARLESVLADFCLKIVPTTPTNEMIEASLATVANFDQKITKTEKHRRRLMAALAACRPRFSMLRRAS
jgi:hypothetical protein